MNYAIILLAILSGNQPEHWSSFRGNGSSHTSFQNLPVKWSDTENLAWKIDLPGHGQSSPVIWNDLVFVSSVDGKKKEKLIIHTVNLKTGKTEWKKELVSSNPASLDNYISKAAPTPVVDENGVYVFFESGDLLAFSHSGEKLWHRDLLKDYGKYEGNHGLGTSPAQNKTNLFLLISHGGPSYLLSIDKQSGKTAWKVDRESKTSWTSPIVFQEGEENRILISSNGVAEEISADNGERLWWVEGLTKNTVPSPSMGGDLIIVGSSKVGDCLAIRRNGKGNVSETNIVWKAKKISSSFSSPLVTDNKVYFVNKAGIAFCNELKTGKKKWESRLPASCWASPITNGKNIYYFCNNGTTVVIPVSDQFEKISENKLTIDDRVYGVAVADKTFVIRTESKLICIKSSEH